MEKQFKIRDFPKIESPFVRIVDKDKDYVITPKITKGYEWCFEDNDVIVSEKINGSNCSCVIQEGAIISIWNRTERIPFINKPKWWIIEGMLEAKKRDWLDLPDGQHFGELCGPLVNSNPLKLDKHLFIPFERVMHKHFYYKSWGKYPRDFKTVTNWLLAPIKDGGIFSLWHRNKNKGAEVKPEGIVFYNPKTSQRAKLRLDMIKEFKGESHHRKEK